MSKRLEILKDIMPILNKYTEMKPWRPSIVDTLVYDKLIGLHESDYNNGSNIPDFIWHKTPDDVMEHIIQEGPIFDLEYGWDSFDEEIRDYLIMNNFIDDPIDNNKADVIEFNRKENA